MGIGNWKRKLFQNNYFGTIKFIALKQFSWMIFDDFLQYLTILFYWTIIAEQLTYKMSWNLKMKNMKNTVRVKELKLHN